MIPKSSLLRDRSRDKGSLGHSRPALSLGLERPRAQPGPAHAADVPRDSRIDGRTDRNRRRAGRWSRQRADDGHGGAARTAGAADRTGRTSNRTTERPGGSAHDRAWERAGNPPAPDPNRPPISAGRDHPLVGTGRRETIRNEPMNSTAIARIKNLFVAARRRFSNADRTHAHNHASVAHREYLADEIGSNGGHFTTRRLRRLGLAMLATGTWSACPPRKFINALASQTAARAATPEGAHDREYARSCGSGSHPPVGRKPGPWRPARRTDDMLRARTRN